MSGAETARHQVVQHRIGGAEMALPPNYTRYVTYLELVTTMSPGNLHILF